jgi:D-sedoheptulose 7-phosphate isomerase
MDLEQRIRQQFEDSASTALDTSAAIGAKILQAAQRMVTAHDRQEKILICGNGGSAADALHFSAELLCRYQRERPPLAAIALSADTATITATANDYAFGQIFSRQIDALGRPGDLLIAITTSGNSPNILEAVKAAAGIGLDVVALTGRGGGTLAGLLRETDIELRIPSDSTARIQEAHAIIIHSICDLIDLHITGEFQL